MSKEDTPDPDKVVSALARDLEHLEQAVTGLTGRAEQLETAGRTTEQDQAELAAMLKKVGETVAGLTTTVTGLARKQQKADAARAVSWLDWTDRPDGPTAQAVAEDLTRWLGRVYLRYPGARLPSCWAWHPAVVEELLWLRQAHAEALTTSGDKLGAWHDRSRPGVVQRVMRYLDDCELSRHRAGADRHHSADPAVPLAEHVDLVAAVWANRRDTSDPTAPMLDAARHIDDPTPVHV